MTLVLLACLTPVALGYTYVTVRSTTRLFEEDLKRETMAAQRGLNDSMAPDVQHGEWDEVLDALRAMRDQGSGAALLDTSGKFWYVLPDFPIGQRSIQQAWAKVKSQGSYEFMQSARGRDWFCRIIPLGQQPGLGYLMVAQDWTDVQNDLYRRTASSIIAAATVVIVIAILIPLVTRRYVSEPLAALSRRVMSFPAGDEAEREQAGDEVRLITEEFRRLAQQLTIARRRLLNESDHKLELERRLLHADKLATMGALASGLAHEIGTPLGVIRGRAEHLLQSRPDQRKIADGLEIIINQIDRITRIVRMLLDFGRRREPVRVTCDLRPILQRSITLLETEAAHRAVRLITDLGQEPLTVDCDADQLQQVFVNLGINALDAMGETGGTLRVTAQRQSERAGERVRVCFDDTGAGVPPQFRERIFDPFFTTKEPGKGTGMGLTVSRSIMRDHDGELTLEQAEMGARFVVTVAVSRAAERHLQRSA